MYLACIMHVSCMHFDVSRSYVHQDTSRYIKIHQDTSRYIKIHQDTSRYIKIHQDTCVSVTLAIIGNVSYLGICILLYDTFRKHSRYIQDTMYLNPQIHDTQDRRYIHDICQIHRDSKIIRRYVSRALLAAAALGRLLGHLSSCLRCLSRCLRCHSSHSSSLASLLLLGWLGWRLIFFAVVALAKRRRKQTDAINERLTPTLKKAFNDYRLSGQPMSMPTIDARLGELAHALKSALDGEYDGDMDTSMDTTCEYCNFEKDEKERERLAQEMDKVRQLPLARLRTHAVAPLLHSAPQLLLPGVRTRPPRWHHLHDRFPHDRCSRIRPHDRCSRRSTNTATPDTELRT
jgi:hypothetical protein